MIEFFPVPAARKTKVWQVVNDGGTVIGHVKFWPAWRQYILDPHPNTVWSHECLSIAVSFLKQQNVAWRLGIQARKGGGRRADKDHGPGPGACGQGGPDAGNQLGDGAGPDGAALRLAPR